MEEFIKEMDDAQIDCYNEFLEILELEHTEDLWDAFCLAWTNGESWGQQMEYSYPS